MNDRPQQMVKKKIGWIKSETQASYDFGAPRITSMRIKYLASRMKPLSLIDLPCNILVL
jgi:hypothetical protein